MQISDILRAMGDTVEENYYPERFADRIKAKQAKQIQISVNISYGMIMVVIIGVIAAAAMFVWFASGPQLIDTWQNLRW